MYHQLFLEAVFFFFGGGRDFEFACGVWVSVALSRSLSPCSPSLAVSCPHLAVNVVLHFQDDCHPKCQWKCDSPVCNQICEPVCEPPKCSTRCQVRKLNVFLLLRFVFGPTTIVCVLC